MKRDEDQEQTLIFVDLLGFAALIEKHPYRIEDNPPTDDGYEGVHTAPTQSQFNLFDHVLDHGDCVAAKLRPGNVSSADDWEERLVPEIDRQQAEGQRVAVRADAAFARPAIYEALEARGVQYAIRIPANKNLELAIEDLLFRSPGRPSLKPLIRYKSFQYQADSWTTPRRVVAKVEHHVGELFPRVGFIVTNIPLTVDDKIAGTHR